MLKWGLPCIFILSTLILLFFKKEEISGTASTTVQSVKQAKANKPFEAFEPVEPFQSGKAEKAEKLKAAHKSRVVKTLVTTGCCGYYTASVAYLLLENGQVIVYAPERIKPPFTKQEAKTIMRAQMGDTVYVNAY